MERLGKLLVVAASLLYVIGLFAQNVALASVGASDLLLSQARGIFVGIWVVLIFFLLNTVPLWALGAWLIPTKNTRNIPIKPRIVLIIFWLIVPGILWSLINRWLFNDLGLPAAVDNFLTALRICGLAVATLISLVIAWRNRESWLTRWTRFSFWLSLGLIAAAAFVEQTSREIIMDIPANYGGSRPNFVRLIAESKIGSLLTGVGVECAPLDKSSNPSICITKAVQLIDESDSNIVIGVPVQFGKWEYHSSLSLKKADVVGIVTEPLHLPKTDQGTRENSPNWPPK